MSTFWHVSDLWIYLSLRGEAEAWLRGGEGGHWLPAFVDISQRILWPLFLVLSFLGGTRLRGMFRRHYELTTRHFGSAGRGGWKGLGRAVTCLAFHHPFTLEHYPSPFGWNLMIFWVFILRESKQPACVPASVTANIKRDFSQHTGYHRIRTELQNHWRSNYNNFSNNMCLSWLGPCPFLFLHIEKRYP